MPNNFVQAGNLDDDFFVDEVKGKIRAINVLTGDGAPGAPPPAPEKGWAYYDVTDDLAAVGYVWDIDGGAWIPMSGSPGGGAPLRSTTAVADGVTVTTLNVVGGLPEFNHFEVEAVTDGARALINLGDPALCPGHEVLITGSVSFNLWARSMGPTVYYPCRTPAVLSGVSAAVGAMGSYDFSGGNAQSPTFNINGTVRTCTLNADYVDANGFFGALAAFFATWGVDFATSARVLPGNTAEAFSFVTQLRGSSAQITVVNAGTGDLATALNAMDDTVVGVDDYEAGPSASNVGSGAAAGGDDYTHAWPDDLNYFYRRYCKVASNGVDWIYTERLTRADEIAVTALVTPEDWDADLVTEVDTNVMALLNELASRLRAVENFLGPI